MESICEIITVHSSSSLPPPCKIRKHISRLSRDVGADVLGCPSFSAPIAIQLCQERFSDPLFVQWAASMPPPVEESITQTLKIHTRIFFLGKSLTDPDHEH